MEIMKHIKLFEEFINESKGLELVHAYDKDGTMYGTGELVKKQGSKTLVRFDRDTEKWFDSKDVKLVESKYNGNIAGDAAEYIAKELSHYVKGIIDQSNDKQTFFHLKNKSDKNKVIKTLRDIYGLEAYDGGTEFSPSATIKFDNDQILESVINEDSTGAFLLIVQAALFAGQLGLLNNKINADGLTPIEDLKRWWQQRKSDKAVKSIVDKIKDDKDIIEFMKLTPSQQRGKFRSLIATKLNDEEIGYLNKINRNHFQNESFVNEAKDATREEIMNLMETKYKIKFVRTTEQFDGQKDGIWIAGDNEEMLGNDRIFDYYNKNAKYVFGVLKKVNTEIKALGWYFSWNDPGTIMIWPNK